VSGEPEQVQPAGAQGAHGNEGGPAEAIRQPHTERASGGRNPMNPNCTRPAHEAERPAVTAAAERSIRITIREAGGWEHTHTMPENLALKLAWQILAQSASYAGEAQRG
jgi:hypothetical protein